MTEHPLLIFPEPARAESAIRGGGGGNVRLPTAERQSGRLAPQFQRLQQASSIENELLGLRLSGNDGIF